MSRYRIKYKKFISYMLSFALTVCIVMSSTLIWTTVTLCNFDFLYKQFTDSAVIDALSHEVEIGMRPVAEQTGIPIEVFTKATDKSFLKRIQSSVLRDMRVGKLSNFSDVSDLERRYKKALEKYFSDNNIEVSEEYSKEVLEIAVSAFNKTCAVKNNSQISSFVESLDGRMMPISTMGILAAIFCTMRLYYLNSRRHKSFAYVTMALMSAGGLMTVLPGALIYKNSLGYLETTNIQVHNMAITICFNKMLFGMIFIGVIFIFSAYAMFLSNNAYYKRKLTVADMEDKIQYNLIQEMKEEQTKNEQTDD